MSYRQFKPWNLILIVFASISVGGLFAYVYTSENVEEKTPNLLPQLTDEKAINNNSQNQTESSSNSQTSNNSLNSNNNYQQNNLEQQYINYFNQGIFYFELSQNSLSKIKQSLDQNIGKNLINDIKSNIHISEQFFTAIPSNSMYYKSAQEYQKYNEKYLEYITLWDNYFNNINVYNNQKIKPPKYPELTIKNKGVFVKAMKPKSIALTFDDGPTPEYTVKVLDILKKHNIKATFFVVGKRVQQYCPIVQRMYQEGHEIANHSYTHPYLTKISAEAQTQEIAYTQQIIEQCIGYQGYQSKWFRAPFGDQNPDLLNIASSFGLNNAQWTIDTNDWRSSSSINSITNVATNNGNSAVILMHDGAKTNPNFIHPEESSTRINTVNALENIIVNYKNRGFSFYTISEVIRD